MRRNLYGNDSVTQILHKSLSTIHNAPMVYGIFSARPSLLSRDKIGVNLVLYHNIMVHRLLK